jgi:hypothetical protein
MKTQFSIILLVISMLFASCEKDDSFINGTKPTSYFMDTPMNLFHSNGDAVREYYNQTYTESLRVLTVQYGSGYGLSIINYYFNSDGSVNEIGIQFDNSDYEPTELAKILSYSFKDKYGNGLYELNSSCYNSTYRETSLDKYWEIVQKCNRNVEYFTYTTEDIKVLMVNDGKVSINITKN